MNNNFQENDLLDKIDGDILTSVTQDHSYETTAQEMEMTKKKRLSLKPIRKKKEKISDQLISMNAETLASLRSIDQNLSNINDNLSELKDLLKKYFKTT